MKSKGFTLIELVVVIVLIGILAVVAAPRFLNIQNDTRTEVLKNLAGSIMSATGSAYGKLAIDGLEHYSYVSNRPITDGNGIQADIPIAGCEIGASGYCVFRYGYADADPMTISNLVKGVEFRRGDGGDFASIYGHLPGEQHMSYITFKDNIKDLGDQMEELKTNQCYIKYASAQEDGDLPTIEVVPCS
ncbi:hypothetical protein ABT56_18390 [Photobacterium aquae]|uniref:MSHA biogenesis protein MshA n=1 Tax=Photobacterium aquae TaxID=1195763 RepID=A0A0J1GUZ3_9GAMM|nr:type II secretion system protein [Photobacterium aquae]KLV03573.1 hypothetical protein ABT56_18390 [Photobacterium aquae]